MKEQFRYSDSEKEIIIKAYQDPSILCDDILKQWGMTKRTLSRLVDQAGIPRRTRGLAGKPRYAENNHLWRGEKFIHKRSGYVYMYVHREDPFYCMAGTRPYVAEHRYNMAKSLNRPLLKGETVHHIDGNKTNNDISNLQLRQTHHGQGSHWRCNDCGSINIQPIEI